jgi:hypothetical protein
MIARGPTGAKRLSITPARLREVVAEIDNSVEKVPERLGKEAAA